MASDIISNRLKDYTLSATEDEEQALKEILQEIALYGLSSKNFFDKAIFQGGTALRILHDLPRFSEDLDFILKEPDPSFEWEPYVDAIISTCKRFGVHPEVTDKSKVDNVVKKMFLKDNSIGKIIDLKFVHHPGKKLAIKLEIDTNPPAGSNVDLKIVSFPLDYSVVAQDLSSNFAGKCHALLCRSHIKGRDWYDFGWYVTQKIIPNFIFLSNAIYQQGPWSKQKDIVTPKWLIETLEQKIKTIDWKTAANDVVPFLDPDGIRALNLWGVDFFMDRLKKFESQLLKK